MSRISEKTRNIVKGEAFNVLSNAHMSTYAVQRAIGRSWKFTLQVLEALSESGKIEKLKIGSLTFWRI